MRWTSHAVPSMKSTFMDFIQTRVGNEVKTLMPANSWSSHNGKFQTAMIRKVRKP